MLTALPAAANVLSWSAKLLLTLPMTLVSASGLGTGFDTSGRTTSVVVMSLFAPTDVANIALADLPALPGLGQA